MENTYYTVIQPLQLNANSATYLTLKKFINDLERSDDIEEKDFYCRLCVLDGMVCNHLRDLLLKIIDESR